MNFLIRIGRLIIKTAPNRSSYNTTIAEQMGLPKFNGEFRPDLKQDIGVYDAFMVHYMKITDIVRVRVPSRYNRPVQNMKYIPYIQQIVISKLREKNPEFKEEEISSAQVKDYYNQISGILSELAYNIYIKEHRLRYQQEQRVRFDESEKRFLSYVYLNTGKSVEQFIIDYNNFIWKGVSKSHLGMSPKIEYNYRRNYHNGEVSPVTSLIFFLYFKTNKWSKYLSNILASSYRNPATDFQKKYV